jgi:hypothetical protein
MTPGRSPWRKKSRIAAVWQITPDCLNQAQKENEAAIERLKRCVATNIWPTGYEECRGFDFI